MNQGIFPVYKPAGLTSHDVIDRLRRKTGIKKIGHAGTLDPLAKGVLVVAVGRQATKQLGDIVAKEKEYLATVRFGQNSSTDDEEGKKTKIKYHKIPENKDIIKALAKFKGMISQKPPIYSAIKVKGRAAYKYARKGKTLDLKIRKVNIYDIEVLKYRWPDLQLKIICGAGVYIRSIARDLGEVLGVGGYLYELERTRVGDFTKQKALSYNIDS